MAKTLPGAPPTKEIGAEVAFGLQYTSGLGRIAPWSQFLDDREYAPELTWPSSVGTYDRMRNDSQIEGLFFGLIQPILRYRWLIDPNGAPSAVVKAMATDLNLDIKDSEPLPRQRRKGRFNMYEHMFQAFLALVYGHYPFEQVGDIITDPDWPYNGGSRWQLKKLAPREPRTIWQINVNQQGGLVSMTQSLPASFSGVVPEIPVDNLIWYAWAKEGPNWVGRSMLRSCFRDWLLKDKLLRIMVINHERAGGIPIAIAPEGATPTEIANQSLLAQSLRVTDTGGGALPYGSKLESMRSAGSDITQDVRYLDEQMARRFLLMVMQLGQTHVGARNLGEVFIDFFTTGQRSVADWFVGTFNEHMMEDWIDWNLGPDFDTVPQLTYEDSSNNERLAVADLVSLISAGALVVDQDLEEMLRDRYNLGSKQAGSPPPVPTVDTSGGRQTETPSGGADTSSGNDGQTGTTEPASGKPAGTKTAASARQEEGAGSGESRGSLHSSAPPRNFFDEPVKEW